MDGDTATVRWGCRHREGILGIAAVEHDAACLRDNLRRAAYHVLHTVYTRVDGCLADAGGTGNDMSPIADTFEGDTITFDYHIADTSAEQVAVFVDVADHDIRGGNDHCVIIAIIVAFVKSLYQVSLDLLNLRLMLMDLLQILLYTALEFFKQLFPIIKYISHNICLL